MPWKASSVMEERLRFVARLLDGEAMTDVCREFGVSRKTGYKIFDRYKEQGLAALSDRSRRPVRYANQLPEQIEGLIVRLKAEKPHWGARKIRELVVRRLDGDVRIPAKSTIHAVLDRHGLVKRGGGPRHRARGRGDGAFGESNLRLGACRSVFGRYAGAFQPSSVACPTGFERDGGKSAFWVCVGGCGIRAQRAVSTRGGQMSCTLTGYP